MADMGGEGGMGKDNNQGEVDWSQNLNVSQVGVLLPPPVHIKQQS